MSHESSTPAERESATGSDGDRPPNRVTTVFEMGLREYVRTPILVALLVFLPAYFVGVFVFVLPDSTVLLEVPGELGKVSVTTSEMYGIMLVPLMGALIGGLAGMFLMQTAQAGDSRLVLAGYRPAQIIVARVGLLLIAGVVAATVSLVVLSVEIVPERLVPFVAATLLVGLIYGLLGTVAGLLLSRLAGVYLMLFVPMLDLFFFQNPIIDEPLWFAVYFPGYFAMDVAVDAGFSSHVRLAPFLGMGIYLVVAAAAATVAFYRSLRVE